MQLLQHPRCCRHCLQAGGIFLFLLKGWDLLKMDLQDLKLSEIQLTCKNIIHYFCRCNLIKDCENDYPQQPEEILGTCLISGLRVSPGESSQYRLTKNCQVLVIFCSLCKHVKMICNFNPALLLQNKNKKILLNKTKQLSRLIVFIIFFVLWLMCFFCCLHIIHFLSVYPLLYFVGYCLCCSLCFLFHFKYSLVCFCVSSHTLPSYSHLL